MDLLIGIQVTEIQPILADERKQRVGNLCLLTLLFGAGYLLDGAYQSIEPHGGYLCNLAHSYTCGRILGRYSLIHHVTASPSLVNFKDETAVKMTKKDHIDDDFNGNNTDEDNGHYINDEIDYDQDDNNDDNRW